MGAQQDIYDRSYVRALFDGMCDSYDRVNFLFSFGFSNRWRRQFLKHIPQHGGQIKVIDLLTGMGETWKYVKERFPGAELSALDFSTGMLKHAAMKNTRHYGGAVNLLEDDIINCSLPDAHYDAVVCAFGLKTFNREQLQLLAHNVNRILKPGGHFSFIEVSIPRNNLLRLFYKIHLKHIVPLAGKMLRGSSQHYNMLWEYANIYSGSEEVKSIFECVGLHVDYDRYFNGCATGVHGQKVSG